MGITGEARRLMFDNAVFSFGTALSNEIAAVEGKDQKDVQRKTERLMNKWLTDTTQKKKYRDPAKRNQEF